MIGNNAQRNFKFSVRFDADDARRRVNQGFQYVRFIVVVRSQHHGAHAFQPHARVNARMRQSYARSVRQLFVLHENQIPNFDKAVAVFVGAARRAALDMFAVIVKDFGTRSARSRIAH
ncbi:uncharacterized protein BN820_00573 [Acetobacter sp. CAG:977]|nr:uncharacterized protein BN820_00573 [Acetobacter sp. CAG:977]